MFSFSFFSDFKKVTHEQLKCYSSINLTLNAWSFAIYFKIFGCKVEMQIIAFYYYKNYSKGMEYRHEIKCYWWKLLLYTGLKYKVAI